MKKISILLAAMLLMVSCLDSNRLYVRKAVRIMDQHGILATIPQYNNLCTM